MNFKPKDAVVNTLTGEVGTVITTHTYHGDPATETLDVPVVSVRFSEGGNAKWILAECLKKL